MSAKKERIAESVCAMKVAHATPDTPQPNERTNSKSSAMFVSDEKIRKYSGVLESPSAVNTPVQMLYRNKKNSEPVYMFR